MVHVDGDYVLDVLEQAMGTGSELLKLCETDRVEVWLRVLRI